MWSILDRSGGVGRRPQRLTKAQSILNAIPKNGTGASHCHTRNQRRTKSWWAITYIS